MNGEQLQFCPATVLRPQSVISLQESLVSLMGIVNGGPTTANEGQDCRELSPNAFQIVRFEVGDGKMFVPVLGAR